jgi:enterochelin esterase-like enzyme
VPWVDAHYRTIQTPQARGIMGMSQGGFCAANLMLRHPNLFSAAISFSGYFHAGAPGGNSLLPFGGDQALMDQFSPDLLAGQLDLETRQELFFVLVAQPAQALYGPEAARFDELLSSEGYKHIKIDDSNPHGWVQVRSTFPTVMAAWAGHLVEQGVFAPL